MRKNFEQNALHRMHLPVVRIFTLVVDKIDNKKNIIGSCEHLVLCAIESYSNNIDCAT